MYSFLSKPFGNVQALPPPRSILLLCAMCISWWTPSYGNPTYDNVTKIFTDKLDSGSGYNTAVRPLIDQSQAINVEVGFDIIAIVEIDDIKQNFIVNGFLHISWTDELLAWDPTQYNDVYLINPYPKQIWRPRLILGNTLGQRDLFEDDYCPTAASHTGSVLWNPGSLFPTSCNLNLEKYPFDQQTCSIELYSMVTSASSLVFTSNATEVGRDFFDENGEWEIVNAIIECGVAGNAPLIDIKFVLKRRPGFFIINIVLPVVLLSFLNIMVFLIPVDSGEKISYGITVLLALAVFMSIVSGMLPRSSDVMPLVTLYLMALLIISVCTVIVAILIVSFHHRDEKETKHHKATESFKSVFKKIRIFNRANASLKQVAPADEEMTPDEKERTPPQYQPRSVKGGVKNDTTQQHLAKNGPCFSELDKNGNDNVYVNKWRIIGKHIDCISFFVFTIIWASVTIGFLVAISS